MNKEKQIMQKLIAARKSIRKKLLAIKLNNNEADELFEKQYKPIIDPLTTIVKNTSTNVNPKFESFEHVFSKKIKNEIKEDDEDIEDGKKEDIEYIKKSDNFDNPTNFNSTNFGVADEGIVNSVVSLEGYESSIKNYLTEMIADKNSKKFDSKTGVRLANNDNGTIDLLIGDSELQVKGKNFVIGSHEFKGTRGLRDLIFLNNPQLFTLSDLKQYKSILLQTNATRRDFDSTKQMQGTKSKKYSNLIKPILLNQLNLVMKKYAINNNTSGKGLKNMLVVDDKPFHYVYYNNINELLDRLFLLHASKAAGNNSHLNEIASIEEELREANIIV